MVEPVIQCPHCHKEIKLTESLAAPLVEATRQGFELKLAEKDLAVARREADLRAEEQSLATARQQIDAQIEEGIRLERQTIALEEASKARRLVSDELEGKANELLELEAVVKAKDETNQKKSVQGRRANVMTEYPYPPLEVPKEGRQQSSLAFRVRRKSEAAYSYT